MAAKYMADSDPIDDGHNSGTFLGMLMDAIGGIQYKFLCVMFLAFLFVSSDIFVLSLLDRVPNAVDFKTPTTYGMMLQGAALVLIMLVMDPLISQKII
jgi:ABC-type branched-subunit amino acid transport system permease subunit